MAEVLVVEDDAVIRRVYEVTFRAAGFDVRSVATAAAAVEAVGARVPDAIVMDLGLPDLDGVALVDRLGTSDVPIVVVSGRDEVASEDGGYAARVDAVLRKPVEPSDVLATVRGLVGER